MRVTTTAGTYEIFAHKHIEPESIPQDSLMVTASDHQALEVLRDGLTLLDHGKEEDFLPAEDPLTLYVSRPAMGQWLDFEVQNYVLEIQTDAG